MASQRLTPSALVASLFGVGFIPFAPGTFGSLLTVAVYLILPRGLSQGSGWIWYGAGLLLLSAVSVWLSTQAEKCLGHDAPQIVIDEACGYLLAVLLLPKTLLVAVYALILFRAFDIAKPWPANILQRLPRGWGVVADDLAAGFYANVLLQILHRIVPRFFGQ